MAGTLSGAPTAGALDARALERFQAAFTQDPRFRQAMNAVCTTSVGKVATNRERVARHNNVFSIHLPENGITAQKGSGRCWMFAALNTFRATAIQRMNLDKEFEFSQNYVMFWDKLEKANYFLENILVTLDEPVGSRLLDHLLRDPIQDGGQWHMFTNLIRKYGVVPKQAMPETESSSSTGAMNGQITGKLRDYACELRGLASAGASEAKLRARKDAQVEEVYRMLVIHLGEPPTQFEWSYRDKDRNFVREGSLTPVEFFDRYVGVDFDEWVCLVHDPRPGHDYGRSYTVKFLGNVVGGEIVRYLNVDLETMKAAAIAQLQGGESVWHGCDVGKFLDRESGVMDPDWFDYGLVYGTNVGLTKAERLMYGHSLMTHAMVFTGVDLDADGRPVKWRVENSWGGDHGDKGFFQMSDPWFDEYNFEVVVRRKFVSDDLLRALEAPPVELEPWDPMGSLA